MVGMAWGDNKGMKKRRETKEEVRHQRGATKKKAIKEQDESGKSGKPKSKPTKKGKKK